MKRNKIITLLLVFVLVLSAFSGCSKNETESSAKTAETATQEAKQDTSTEKKENVTESTDTSDEAWDASKEDTIILTVINNYYTAGEKKLAEEYMKLHPETKVVVDVVSDNDAYMTKMKTIFTGDLSNAPDIVHGNFLSASLGSYTSLFEKNYLMDLAPLLEETNPYNDGLLVKDVYDSAVLVEALNTADGKQLPYLPFDKCGIAFYYNKTLFDQYGLTAPTSYENLLEICETFRQNGYENPVTVGGEASWILASIADAGFRGMEQDFLIQPGDALYDETTMNVNKDFTFDENNMLCDQYTVSSMERLLKYRSEDSIFSSISKTSWSEFQKLGQYFPVNWITADGAQNITDFESQNSPILLNGSWNVGLILDDVNKLPVDKQFEWATFQIPSYDNAPEGFASTLRGLYVFGNAMSIIPKESEDHNARVKDFYKFWYSPKNAQMVYEETLSNGNYVQGPCMINGVNLSQELNSKLNGFIATGACKSYSSEIIGMYQTTEADRPIHNDLINKFTAGKITLDEFLDGMAEVLVNDTNDKIERGGYDLDPTTADTAK